MPRRRNKGGPGEGGQAPDDFVMGGGGQNSLPHQ